jgi:E3 SUMO-protein ligase PIAS1
VLFHYANSSDQASLLRLQQRIYNHGEVVNQHQYLTPGAPIFDPTMASYASPANTPASNGYSMPADGGVLLQGPANMGKTRSATKRKASLLPLRNESKSSTGTVLVNLRGDPFVDLRDPVSKVHVLPIIQANRHTVNVLIDLNHTHVERLRADSTMRVFLYCSNDDMSQLQASRAHVAFPQQIDVKVNGTVLTANFKGLKNKPGSTKPSDITPYLKRNQPHQSNTVAITYAMTTRKFFAVAVLAQKRSVNELVNKIKGHNVITKATVLQEMRSKAEDPDIVATSTVMSLKDNVAYVRMKVPCRSNVCSHNQCFDAASFLQLQEQAPTWSCPVCSKHIRFDAIAVDQYVQEILEQTPTSIDQVTIEPDGRWSYSKGANSNGSASKVKRENSAQYDDEDDESDDLVEIYDPRFKTIKSEAPATPFSFARTTPAFSREASTSHAAPTAARAGQKRKSEVIDLTLSDDEEPPRPAKRQAYSTPNSLPDQQPRNGYSSFSGTINGTTQFQPAPTDQPSFQTGRLSAPQTLSMPNAFNWASYSSPTPLSPFAQLAPPPPNSNPPSHELSPYQQPLAPFPTPQAPQGGFNSAPAQGRDVQAPGPVERSEEKSD